MININSNIDYNRKKTVVSVLSTSGFYAPATAHVIDENGTMIQSIPLASTSGPLNYSLTKGEGNLGLFPATNCADQGIARTDLSGIRYNHFTSNWQLSAESDFLDFLKAIETGSAAQDTFGLDERNDVYNDTPILITRGDAVLHGTISSVTSGNIITIASDKLLYSYTGANLTNCIGTVISGSKLNQSFAVTSYTLGQTSIYVDRDLTTFSGQLVKLMPYRISNSYSGWAGYTGGIANKGSGGINVRFAVTENVPTTVGSMRYSTGFYSGTRLVFHPADPSGGVIPFTYTGAVVALSGDNYQRDVNLGDLVYYNPLSNPSLTNTGVILYTGLHNNAAEGAYTITFWPAVVPASNSTYTIARANALHVQSYPKFDQDYTVSIIDTSGQYFATTIHSPTAEVDIVANEFESQFGPIPESSNFHIGPVHLSNGQVLDDWRTYATGIPHMYMTATVVGGDPNNPTTHLSETCFSTQHSNIAHNHNGAFYTGGTFTVAADVSFIASETLTCKADVRLGAAKISKTVSIPVQPAI